jgi:hypothetical protein
MFCAVLVVPIPYSKPVSVNEALVYGLVVKGRQDCDYPSPKASFFDRARARLDNGLQPEGW